MVMWLSRSSRLSTGQSAFLCLTVGFAISVAVMLEREVLPQSLGLRPELTVLGVFGCVVVAMANGANDIANSVGTSYGAKALTLRQAILFGSIAEFTGAVSLGSFVAKSIAKGVIDPATFAADGCRGTLTYGLGMIAVLAGTGSTTLLATLYGLPISASHGVIGGLVAVGTFSHGAASLGAAPLVATVIAWVASPVLGGITSGAIHAMVRSAVHEADAPAVEAYRLQPLLVAVTAGVAAAFLVVSGPEVLRITPLPLAVAVSAGLGCAAAMGLLAHRALVSPSSARSAGGSRSSLSHEEELAEAKPFAAVAACTSSASAADAGLVEDPAGRSDGRGERAGAAADGLTQAGAVHPAEEQPFVPLLVLSALTVSFAHGANDLGNSIGPLAAILVIETPNGDITKLPSIPVWLLLLGAGGFVVGIAMLGSRTITTVGAKITQLTPSRSFAVQMGTAVAVLSSTVLGLAVSTSHCLVGSIIGIGIADKLRGTDGAQLNFAMILKIVTGWAVTIPLAMAVSVLALAALQPSYTSDPVCDVASRFI